ncbi:hypothetical protein ACFOEY_19630 [Paracandidimonas soli]|uniref:hypothetical protein n=1 Tax=Paracandidimonas soli TaxID=1917182 RepID=UPI0036181CE6
MQTPQIYLPGQAVPELEGTSAGIMRGDDGTRYVLVVPNDPPRIPMSPNGAATANPSTAHPPAGMAS